MKKSDKFFDFRFHKMEERSLQYKRKNLKFFKNLKVLHAKLRASEDKEISESNTFNISSCRKSFFKV